MVLIEDITDKRGGGPQEQQQQQQPSTTTAATTTTIPSPPADVAAATAPAPPAAAAADNDEDLEEYEDPEISPPDDDDQLPSDERMRDAHEIEQLVGQLQRPTAKLHVTSLITKLRRESGALQRLEKTHQLQQSPTKPDRKTATDENKDPVSKRAAPPKASPPAAASVLAPPPQPIPVALAAASSSALTGGLHAYYVPIDTFAFDAGGYNSPFVTLYVELPRVGSIPRDAITCHFTKSSVDLIVRNLDNKSYRLYKDNLDKDVDPTKCKIIVKSNKILVKLAKVKSSEYGSYDYWTQLTAKKSRTSKAEKKKEDPSASIMQLMRDMYEDGDDSMRKVIGETMLKQQRGELGGANDPMGGGGMGMGGLKDDDDDEDF
jgi:calcyclin binding protein